MTHIHPANVQRHDERSLGDRAADWAADHLGSWKFVIFQTVIITVWMSLNLTAMVHRWDPYPFILLNLAFSMQAAYAAPILQLAQNRQTEHDRQRAEEDYRVNQTALQLLYAIAKDLNITVPEEDK